MPRFFATAPRGTEEVLAAELRALGSGSVEAGRGGAAFGEKLVDGYRACLWSRVASRVLMPLAQFEAGDADALYEGVHAIDWTDHLGPDRTLAVDAAGGGRAPAGPRHFVALKTKDAIVDRIRSAEGSRPNVDTERPDVRVNVHLNGDRVTVNLDLAGGSLHRRGIGRSGAAAPLKENLAAAVLHIAGWPARFEEAPLCDPFCGSGTLLLEAAWMALDVAPGMTRAKFGAEAWRGHDAALWKKLCTEAAERQRVAERRDVRIAGSDASQQALRAARGNLKRAGIRDRVRLDRLELRDVEPPWETPGLVVTNPPYGERLGETGELGPLYETLGNVLRRRFLGWSAWVLTGNPALAKRIGLRPASRHVLHNGPIESRLLEIPIADAPVAGDRGPGWRKPGKLAASFAKRLRKNLRQLEPWAEREGLTCYRLFDADMPEYNLAVDWYDGAARVEEYARPRKIAAADADRHLREALAAVPETLGIDPADVVLRVRARRAPGEQHQRRGDRGKLREVREGDLRFLVNLSDYLDTGLFLDDRLLRRRVRDRARGADFLNLFAYTCTVSVAAAAGGARSTTSVDLSNGYLRWGRQNFAANGIALGAQHLVRADVLRWVARGGDRRRYDLIFLAPPTYSRSRRMSEEFDVQQHHAQLLSGAARLLTPKGELIFTTNLRGFVLDEEGLPGLAFREITLETTPPDFERRPRLRAWTVRQLSDSGSRSEARSWR
jgi:23S rRNA (guanine2445-N2)-methyltransferase / 23S rRNA (guanine2069-N7)-methyltransferase